MQPVKVYHLKTKPGEKTTIEIPEIAAYYKILGHIIELYSCKVDGGKEVPETWKNDAVTLISIGNGSYCYMLNFKLEKNQNSDNHD